MLSEPERNVTFNDGKGGVTVCDSELNGWYRIQGEAGTMMPTKAPALGHRLNQWGHWLFWRLLGKTGGGKRMFILKEKVKSKRKNQGKSVII